MAVWAIVPVKPLSQGKSRLSLVLDKDSRKALNHYLLENTLGVLTAVPEIEQVVVVSRDPQALTLARSFQARTIQETGVPRLNEALKRATLFAKQYSVHGVLVVPADLPLINTCDIQRMLSLEMEPPLVAIAPDRHQHGTNALFISPPGVISYRFGVNSFQVHCQYAMQSEARLVINELPALSLDLDTMDDLRLLRQQMRGLGNENLHPLFRLGIPDEVREGGQDAVRYE